MLSIQDASMRSHSLAGVGSGTGADPFVAAVRPDGTQYATVSASQTDQALGAAGAVGDYLSHITISPATTDPGPVTVKDGSGSAIPVFQGGDSSVATLHPFSVPIGMVSRSGGWSVSTGSNVSAIAVGKFS